MGLAHSPSIVTSGLVLCLDAANRKSYPGSGTTWTDLSENGYTGTLTNGPTFSTDNQGQLITDGIDDYIQSPYILPISDWTIICTFRLITLSFWAGIWACETWNTGNGYLAYFTATNQLNFVRGGGSGFSTDPSLVTNINNFNHYAFTLNSSGSGSIFINGSQRSTGSITLSSTVVNTIKLGTRHSNDGTGITDNRASRIGSFSIYNRVLTAAEIQQNFNALRGRYAI